MKSTMLAQGFEYTRIIDTAEEGVALLSASVDSPVDREDQCKEVCGSGRGHEATRELFETGRRALDPCEGEGYFLVNLETFNDSREHLEAIALTIVGNVMKPLLISGKPPFWSELSVFLDAAPQRTHGVGCNPAHVDMLAKQSPPDLIAFLCIRPDPLGGGETELCDLFRAAARLSNLERSILEQPIFRYWADMNTYGVGEDLERFSIIPETQRGFIRYTEKMVPHFADGKDVLVAEALERRHEIGAAFESYSNCVQAEKRSHMLQSSDLLVFDQRRFSHARAALGEGQGDIPMEQRRLLLQGYGNYRSPYNG